MYLITDGAVGAKQIDRCILQYLHPATSFVVGVCVCLYKNWRDIYHVTHLSCGVRLGYITLDEKSKLTESNRSDLACIKTKIVKVILKVY